MTIQGSNLLVSHLLLIEIIIKELRQNRPDLSDQDAFMLAKMIIEKAHNKNYEVPVKQAS